MKTQKLFTLIILVTTVASCVFAQKYMTLEELRNMNKKKKVDKVENKDVPKVVPAPKRTGMTMKLAESESLADGSYSKMEKPFIYVARTAEEYNNIKDLVEGFSPDKKIDFKKQAVIAAFAGMKNSGGYSIQIYKMQGRTNVLVKSPPKDAMVTQAITYPYKIAVIDIQEEDSFNIAVSEEFQNEMESYKITDAQFEFEGGFIGRLTKFQATGTISVLKYNELVTFGFELKEMNNESGRILTEMASGNLKNNSANITRVEAGSFIDRPHPPLNVSVKFMDDKLTMKFEPGKRDYIVNDGYVGRGTLTAVKQ